MLLMSAGLACWFGLHESVGRGAEEPAHQLVRAAIFRMVCQEAAEMAKEPEFRKEMAQVIRSILDLPDPPASTEKPN